MAYATGGGGKTVKTTGTVGGDGEITTHIDQVKAGTNVTFTSSGTTLTIASTAGGGGSGNTLDAAYDQGGSGAGRTVTVDNGAVTLEGGASEVEILRISPDEVDGDVTIPFRIRQGADYKFAVDSETNGNIVHSKGPPQSTFASHHAIKEIDPSAVDLQFYIQDTDNPREAVYSARSIGSGLFAGVHNTIGAEGSAVESTGHPSAERSSFSTIIGGSENTVSNQTGEFEMKGATIVGSEASRIEYDNAQKDTWTLVGWNPPELANKYSTIIGGGNNRIKLSSGSAVAASTSSNIVGSQNSAVIASHGCSIDTGDTSAGPVQFNAIIASRSSNINAATLAPNPGIEEAMRMGLMNAMVACDGATIEEEPRNCLLVGEGPKASGDSTGNFDDSCIIVGGGKANAGPTDTSFNAIALVGKNYTTTGTAGAGQILVDHSVLTTGADFAEAFEWNDGNPDNEDRVGLFVKLSTNDSGLPNGKIEVGGENTIGPVSAVPGFLSNVTPLKWKDHFLKDDFDREIKDAEGNRTLNPNYDSQQKYKSRSARKEWAPIGMVGRLRVRASTNIGVYPSNKSGLTVNVDPDGTVSDAGAKGKYKVIQVVKQKEIWSGPEGVFRRRRQVQDHGYGVVEILVV